MSIEAWIIKKELKIAESQIREALGVPDPGAQISEKLAVIDLKLDRLLSMPYKVALLHLREGNLEKAADKLKEAIELQPLNIAALVRHIQILLSTGKLEAALDGYWDLLESFSYRQDLVPPALYEIFVQKTLTTPVLGIDHDHGSLRYGLGDLDRGLYVHSVWCSPSTLAIEWRKQGKPLFLGKAISIYGWGDSMQEHFSRRWACPTLVMLTRGYAVLLDFLDRYQVFSLPAWQGLPENPLDRESFEAIFLPQDRPLEKTSLYKATFFDEEQLASGKAGFADAALRSGTYEQEDWDFNPPRQFQYSGGTLEWSTRPLPLAQSQSRRDQLESCRVA